MLGGRTDIAGSASSAMYLDEKTLMGSPADLAAALHIVEHEHPPLDGSRAGRNTSRLQVVGCIARPLQT